MRMVQGVGINDVSHLVKVDGVHIPSYRTWTNILQRCYNTKFQEKHPTYIGCSVCRDWLLFSNFETWFCENHVDGWHLDKDLLYPDNKIYSPETCLFVPRRVNNLIIDSGAIRGEYPIGVCYHSRDMVYVAQVCVGSGGRPKHIGYFDTPELAHAAYLKEKTRIVDEMRPLLDSIDPRLYDSILSRYKV